MTIPCFINRARRWQTERCRRSAPSSCRRRAGIILAILIIAVGTTVAVVVGPDRAGDTADGGADHGAFEQAEARDHRTGGRAKRGTANGARRDATKRGIIALRLAGIILAVLVIAVGIAVIVIVGPHRAGETADAGADRGTFDDADAGHDRAERSAAGRADRGALRHVTGHAAVHAVGRARAERNAAGHEGRQNHLLHVRSPTCWFRWTVPETQCSPAARAHVTSPQTLREAMRSCAAPAGPAVRPFPLPAQCARICAAYDSASLLAAMVILSSRNALTSGALEQRRDELGLTRR